MDGHNEKEEKLYYVVRKGTNDRIMSSANIPLIISEKNIDEEIRKAKLKRPDIDYDAIFIRDYNNKYRIYNAEKKLVRNRPIATIYALGGIDDITWKREGSNLYIYCKENKIALLTGVHGGIRKDWSYPDGYISIISDIDNRILVTIATKH